MYVVYYNLSYNFYLIINNLYYYRPCQIFYEIRERELMLLIVVLLYTPTYNLILISEK